MREREDSVWLHVSFDLPTTTREQKREYRRFRGFLLENGFSMSQFSVYVRYLYRFGDRAGVIRDISREVPQGGEICVLTLTNHAWSQATRFANGVPDDPIEEPQQLELF